MNMAGMDGRTLLDILDGVRRVLWAVSEEFGGRDAEDFNEAYSLLTAVTHRLYFREHGEMKR